MSIAQTYYLAHNARGKLSKEISRTDLNLRLLVGHANFLDSMMLDLAEAEREQESRFNQTVKGAAKVSEEQSRHIQWADTIMEEAYEEDNNNDSGLEFDEDEDVQTAQALVPSAPKRAAPSAQPPIATVEPDSEGDKEDLDYEDEDSLLLTRTSSHTPELSHDSDSDSDDSTPPSPPQATPLDAFGKSNERPSRRHCFTIRNIHQNMLRHQR